jgi:hypothetical protein
MGKVIKKPRKTTTGAFNTAWEWVWLKAKSIAVDGWLLRIWSNIVLRGWCRFEIDTS